MFPKEYQYKRINGRHIYHQILRCDKLRQHETIELAKCKRPNMVPAQHVMKVIERMTDIEQPVTRGQIDDKSLTFGPREKRLDSLSFERKRHYYNGAYETYKDAYNGGNMYDVKLAIF